MTDYSNMKIYTADERRKAVKEARTDSFMSGLFAGIFVMILIGSVCIGTFIEHSIKEKFRPVAVCQYLGGTIHGDVCIKNGKVVPTK